MPQVDPALVTAAERLNFVLATYDSCRYDVLVEADTPVLDSFAQVRRAQSPANFTYAAHHAFFAGILPHVVDPVPYYNRFTKQLMGIAGVGETNVVKDALVSLPSEENLIEAFRADGYRTIGTGAMNWFRQAPLRTGFDRFLFTGTDAERQIDFLIESLPDRGPFFGFVNFGETHAPFSYRGKPDRCPVDVRARVVVWPPVEQGPVGRDNEAFWHQARAAEFLDRQLGVLLSALPESTIVVLCGDHGECFGEDGYWGHGFNHPMVLEVPLAIFALDGRDLLETGP
jgi:membrane-anchored protein YejM (alkaline phosphatase superfamily)